ncbi:MAG TPA: hypothetical protein VFZ10_12115 [Geminicoccaceae bacterium]
MPHLRRYHYGRAAQEGDQVCPDPLGVGCALQVLDGGLFNSAF